ncbi:hybrid-cluster NAD(P)-dependent oxidoreductase [Vibrio sp. 10N.286.49.B3]|uniref:hybrid-cluster NAD(P)-dependent oxidoreductase n=1 Tax=Vibrio sp. 10N.286.49.B3 TaxID=1880855 RepID=UPI000C840BBA|nr:hybrid-cluster NAD(P)-dependent oxidoreductase [Vibrio sp. 10N.286.49.B3]PMH44501.1 hybrid-cluster NAD(P)-dependent oxidoreductase [Vibrio sp. 10N.286.49.B3]
MNAWANSGSIELVCCNKWFETEDTVSIEFKALDQAKVFDFKPGQFVSLGVEVAGKMEYRAYSISSLPMESVLKLTIKRVAGGKVSNFIIDSLKSGDIVTALKPTGSFNSIDCALDKVSGDSAKVVLISAGCGITPVMAMAKHWLEHAANVDITFVHQSRSVSETIYFAELENLAKTHTNFNLKLLVKNAQQSDYPQGRLDQDWLVRLCSTLDSSTVFLCGPTGFMHDVESYLQNIDFNMARFYQESFTPVEQSDSSAASTEVSREDSKQTVTVSVPEFSAVVEVEPDSSLIDALEKGGVPIIAACRSGICGSCKCKVKSGTVTTTSQETLSAEEIENGYVLACSSQIKSDVEVNIN